MNPHRLHYFEANGLPRPPQPRTPDDMGRLLAAALVLFFLLLVGVHVLVLMAVHADPEPRAQTAAEARIEGYRAGQRDAQEQGCRAALLSEPLAR